MIKLNIKIIFSYNILPLIKFIYILLITLKINIKKSLFITLIKTIIQIYNLKKKLNLSNLNKHNI